MKKPQVGTSSKTKIPVQKLPKPKFTVGPENPEQYAKEKNQYIKSIWETHIRNEIGFHELPKENKILGLQALQKYGSRADIEKIQYYGYDISKDTDIFKEYVKFVRKVGTINDISPIRAKLDEETLAHYNESTIEEMLATIKHFDVDLAPPKYHVNTSWTEYMEFEALSKHTNPKIAENAKAIMKRLEQDNPWIHE